MRGLERDFRPRKALIGLQYFCRFVTPPHFGARRPEFRPACYDMRSAGTRAEVAPPPCAALVIARHWLGVAARRLLDQGARNGTQRR